jgi:transposase-like protein
MDNHSFNLVKKRYEDLKNAIEWAVEIWRSNNWVNRLVLLDVLLFIGFNPYVKVVLILVPAPFIPKHYDLYFWVIIVLIFIVALAIGIRAKTSESVLPELDKRSPIKGLLPFSAADEEVFARLQRHTELLECAQAVTNHNFRFGILSADSGNGKTSFLQAGLLPALLKRDYLCVYVKFTDLDPILTIRQALAAYLPVDLPSDISLAYLFQAVTRPPDKAAKSVVLLFDQFEQFFVHQKRKKDREPFIHQLDEWYNGDPGSPVKLLVSIRGDFRGRLDEVQKGMGCSLGPQQVFNLDKFTPEQSAEIFRVIAELAQLEYSQGFIEEMAAQELAATEDGLISPVDIQILAWMIARQAGAEERAFTRSSFQKLGGVEGLLERFVTRALDARETPSRRQAAIKVLLALTDLERNARAGVLTLDDLRKRLNSAVSESDLNEAIEWLVRGDVRLAVPVKRGGAEGYELAHERLIPALRRIVNKELSDADRANLLLDRRTNEWQGNNRDNRYLFSRRELQLITNQTPFLQWGQNRNVKKALIAASKQRLRIRLAMASLPLLFLLATPIFWYTQWGQLQLIKWHVAVLSRFAPDPSALTQVAKAYVMMDDFYGAQQVAEKISHEDSRAAAMVVITKTMAEMGAEQRDEALLRQAQEVAEKISREEHRSVALWWITSIVAEAGSKRRDEALLRQAQQVVEKISREDHRAYALKDVAKAMAEAGLKRQAVEYLRQAQEVAEKISSEDSRANALRDIAKAMAEMGAEQRDETLLRQAQQVSEKIGREDFRAYALRDVATAMAEAGLKRRDETLLRQAQEVAEKISSEYSRANALKDVAKAMAEAGLKRQAVEYLRQAQQVAEKISNEYSRANALSSIAKAMAEVGAEQRDETLLRQAQQVSEKIGREDSGADALKDVAKAMAEAGLKRQAVEYLKQAQEVAEKISGEGSRVNRLRGIAKAMAEVGAEQRDETLLRQAQQLAEKIGREDSRADALKDVATAMAEAGLERRDETLLRQAQEVAEKIGREYSRANALSEIAIAMAEAGLKRRDETLLRQAQEVAEKIRREDSRADALNKVSTAMAEVGSKQRDVLLLKRALQTAEEVFPRSGVMRSIAQYAARLGDLRTGIIAAYREDTFPDALKTFAVILETEARTRNPYLADKDSKGRE